MKQERYRPSREELANAEQSMTEEQEALSLDRAKEVKQREVEALSHVFSAHLKLVSVFLILHGATYIAVKHLNSIFPMYFLLSKTREGILW